MLGLPLEDVSPRAIISIFEHSMRSIGEKVEQLSAAMSILRVPNQRTITVEEIEKAKEDGAMAAKEEAAKEAAKEEAEKKKKEGSIFSRMLG